jgi:hypothetical protein
MTTNLAPLTFGAITNPRDKEVLYLDYVGDCNAADCPFYSRCGFLKNGFCGFEASFYAKILRFMNRLEAQGQISDIAYTHMTIAILPLYRQLLMCYKLECSLNNEIMYKGRIHPVYKEIREILSKIGELWKVAEVSNSVLRKAAGPQLDFNAETHVYEFAEEV